MLTAFTLKQGRLEQIAVDSPDELLPEVVWVDLINPTDEERRWVNAAYHQELPTPAEVNEIEASARFFEDEDGYHIHSYFLHDFDSARRNITVAFTLRENRLFTLHEEDLLTFRILRMRARRQPGMVSNAVGIMLALFETKVERLADLLEEIYSQLEMVSQGVLGHAAHEMEMNVVVSELARQEDSTGKARLSLMDKQRALSFLLRSGLLQAEQAQIAREILRDIDSLTAHTSFLFDKVNFLMDAVMSFVNIEQNQIIKIFSIAAVVFLPPTLVASIYGMNFHYMPELSWPLGYPLAIVLMILSGIAPYWYFKRRGWL